MKTLILALDEKIYFQFRRSSDRPVLRETSHYNSFNPRSNHYNSKKANNSYGRSPRKNKHNYRSFGRSKIAPSLEYRFRKSKYSNKKYAHQSSSRLSDSNQDFVIDVVESKKSRDTRTEDKENDSIENEDLHLESKPSTDKKCVDCNNNNINKCLKNHDSRSSNEDEILGKSKSKSPNSDIGRFKRPYWLKKSCQFVKPKLSIEQILQEVRRRIDWNCKYFTRPHISY